MALSTVGAVAEAVTAVADLAQPILDQHVSEKYDNELQARNQQLAGILGMPTNDDDEEAARADALQRYLEQLCIDAGAPTGGFGDDISVPVSFIQSLCTIANNKIHTDGELAELLSALEKAKA